MDHLKVSKDTANRLAWASAYLVGGNPKLPYLEIDGYYVVGRVSTDYLKHSESFEDTLIIEYENKYYGTQVDLFGFDDEVKFVPMVPKHVAHTSWVPSQYQMEVPLEEEWG